MKFHSHLNTAISLIEKYDGKIPFTVFLKDHFKEHKKFGSKDRKNIASFCYGYYRLGAALMDIPISEKILAGLFLSSNYPDELIEFFKPEWNEIGSDSIHKRLEIVKRTHPSFDLLKVFTGINELSASIEKEAFILSHLLQPDFFCRIRPGFENEVLDNLSEKNKLFSFIPPATVAFNSRIDLEKLFTPDRELVVQDLSSQEVGSFFSLIKVPGMQVWDCCAGSGGKSILAFDLLPDCKLTVSDKRDSILINLIKRFRAARIQQYISFTADVSRMPIKSKTQFDLIIADVPCSGSGTWSRTPEQLISFDPQMITKYADLQKQITGNILHNLKTGGYVLYVTCSVFEQENEQIVRHLSTQFPLTIIKHGIIKGYDRKADTLYAALLRLDATLK